jgi:hypothetical protein
VDSDRAVRALGDAQATPQLRRQGAASGLARVLAQSVGPGAGARGGARRPRRMSGESQLPQDGRHQRDERQQRHELDGGLTVVRANSRAYRPQTADRSFIPFLLSADRHPARLAPLAEPNHTRMSRE